MVGEVSAQKYRDGKKCAELTATQIKATGVRNKHQAAAIANFAFAWYFALRNGVDKSTSPEAAALKRDLRSALYSGAGLSDCDDLNEVFIHLEKNNGNYTSNNTAIWYPKFKQYRLGAGHIGDLPKGVVRFLDALHPLMQRRALTFGKGVRGLIALKKRARRKRTTPSGVEVMKYVRFLRHGLVVQEVCKLSLTALGRARFNKLHLMRFNVVSGAANSLVALQNAYKVGASNKQAASLALLAGALAFVPVLGQLYANMIVGVPDLIRMMKWAKRNASTSGTRTICRQSMGHVCLRR